MKNSESLFFLLVIFVICIFVHKEDTNIIETMRATRILLETEIDKWEENTEELEKKVIKILEQSKNTKAKEELEECFFSKPDSSLIDLNDAIERQLSQNKLYQFRKNLFTSKEYRTQKIILDKLEQKYYFLKSRYEYKELCLSLYLDKLSTNTNN